MRISRKIGLGFFITFLLVIILGALSIYSLRHVYKGLGEVFSKDLPASRLSYQVSVSAEEVLSNLNNFFITANENFKASYERSYKRLRDDMAGLKGFIFEPEERALYEEAAAAVNDINDYASAVFKNSSELKGLFKEIRKTGADYNQKLDRLSGIEEDKMLGEKDLLLIQAQHVPASTLVMQAKTEFLALMDVLSGYLMGGQGGGDPFSPDQLGAIDKYIKDYKNYHSYSLSDEERSIAMSLVDLSEGLRSRLSEALALKDSADRLADSILAKEKTVMEALDKIIAYKKSGISVKLGIGAALTEDIPAIHNISKIEKDIVESWRLSARYILTKSQENRESYYSLRQGIENEMKDYGRHARLRGTESFLEDVIDADKKILDAISSSMDTFNKKENSRAEMLSIKAGIEKNIDELLGYNDARIKGGRDSQEVSGRFAPARWSLIRLKAGLYDAGRLIVNYLNEQESVYKDSYAELYFSMKKDINAYRNLAGGDARDLALINEAEAGLDRFNAVTQDVISAHDAVIKDVGWTLVKLEERLKDGIAKAVDSEIAQLDKNKRDLKGRIAIINTLIFVIIGAVALIMVFVVFYTRKSITNPMRDLYKGAEIIGRGNLDHRLDIRTGDEIQDLAEGFNNMAGELKGLYTNLENKVKERTAQLAEANEALARTNKELDDFTYIVSHDLKEPLRGVKAFTKLLLEDYSAGLDDEGKQHLRTISDSSARMTRLIEDLLNLSRIGRIKNMEQGIDLNEVLSDVGKNLVYALEERKADLKIRPDFPKVTCDRIRISEVFSNLVSNAIKYTKKDTRPVIEIGWADKGGFFEFYVKDNGIGIEKQYHDKIFQIFQRLHARDEYEGTGAGLTIVKKIVENHSGRIWVESEPGKGSVFYFTLPKSQTS